MADIIIDLSGKTGLADGHAGDKDMVTPQPNLRQANSEGQFVGGLFNPYLRDGYLSPIPTSYETLTPDIAADSEFIASEYDQVSDTVFLADDTSSLYLSSGLNDATPTQTLVLEAADVGTYPDRKYQELYDVQMYQVNGERKLFYVGKGMTYGPTKVSVNVGTQSPALDCALLAASILPAGSTKPTIVSSERAYLSSGNESVSFTVTGGTNHALFALVITDGANDLAGATYRDVTGTPSYPMTVGASGSGGGFHWELLELADPQTVTTGEVRFFVNSSPLQRIVYIFETTDTHQTVMADAEFESTDTSPLLAGIQAVSNNQLDLVAAYADSTGVSRSLISVDEVLESGTNTYGSDYLWKMKNNVSGVQVGIADIDLTTSNAADPNWLHQKATGGFIHELPNSYAFIRTADNGYAYLFAGHRVHRIDGSTIGGENGTVTKDVLLFPEYFQITDAVDYRSAMYLVVHQYPVSVQTTNLGNYTGRCGVVVWNRVSSQLGGVDYIEITGAREIKKIYVSPDGVLKLITISDSGITELRQFGYNDSGGVVFPVARELGIGAYPRVPDGCSTAGDKTVWLANNGNLYCEKMNAITKLFQASEPGTSSTGLAENITAGAILYGADSATASTGYRSNRQGIFLSYTDGTIKNQKVYPFDLTGSSNTSQNVNTGDVYTGVTYIPVNSTLRNVRVYNLPIVNGGASEVATIKLYFNQSTTASGTTGMTKTVTASEAQRGYVDFQINKQYVHAIQLEIEWSDQVVLGANTYYPSIATITTEDTRTATKDNG